MVSDFDFLVDSPGVVSKIKTRKIEGLCRLRLPQAQAVRHVGAISEDGGVIGEPVDHIIRHPANMVETLLVVILLGVPAKLHLHLAVGGRDLPWIAQLKPFIGAFDLPAIFDDLLEHAELVANTIAYCGYIQRGERIHITRSQSSQSAISQARLGLRLDQFAANRIPAQKWLEKPGPGCRACSDYWQGVSQAETPRTNNKRRDILLSVVLDRIDPARHHPIAYRMGERHVKIVLIRNRRILPHCVVEMIEKRALQGTTLSWSDRPPLWSTVPMGPAFCL